MTETLSTIQTDAYETTARRLREAAAESGLPPWLRQVLELAAADPAALEDQEDVAVDPFNFIYFH